MRARYPDADGYIERDGVRVFYERYGDGDPTVLLLPGHALGHQTVPINLLLREFVESLRPVRTRPRAAPPAASSR